VSSDVIGVGCVAMSIGVISRDAVGAGCCVLGSGVMWGCQWYAEIFLYIIWKVVICMSLTDLGYDSLLDCQQVLLYDVSLEGQFVCCRLKHLKVRLRGNNIYGVVRAIFCEIHLYFIEALANRGHFDCVGHVDRVVHNL